MHDFDHIYLTGDTLADFSDLIAKAVRYGISGVDERTVDNTMEYFLQEIVDATEYNALYCGHWHTEKQDGKIRFLFHDVIMLE